jgi:hypothetical protein
MNEEAPDPRITLTRFPTESAHGEVGLGVAVPVARDDRTRLTARRGKSPHRGDRGPGEDRRLGSTLGLDRKCHRDGGREQGVPHWKLTVAVTEPVAPASVVTENARLTIDSRPPFGRL